MRRSLFFLGASFGLALLLPLGDALTQAAPGGRGGGGGGGMRMGGGGGGGMRSGGSSFGGGARMGGGSSIARSGGNFGGGSPRMSSGFGSLSGIGGGARSAAPTMRSTPSLGGRSLPNIGSSFSARPSTNLGSNFSARPSTNLGSLGNSLSRGTVLNQQGFNSGNLGGRSLGSTIQPGNRLGSQLGNSLGNNPLRGSTTLSNGQITRGGLGNLGQNNSALNNLGRNVLGQNNSGLNSALRPNSNLNQALNNSLGNRGLNNQLNGNRLGSNTLNNGLNGVNGLNGGRNGLSQATQALAGANRNGLRNVNVNNINNVNRVSNVNNVVNNVLNNRGNNANFNNGNWNGWNGNWNNNNWGRNGNWNNGHWHGNGNWNGYHHHHNHGWYNNYSWYRGHRHNPWGYYGGFGGWGWWGVGLGWGNGWGYNNWGYGYPYYGFGYGLTSLLYRSGYCSYYNPYYVATPVVVYDYAQPIPVPVADVAQVPVPAAVSDLDLARQEFLANDYADALAAVNRAIQAQPGDPVLHELRALILFAMGDYDQAAATLYSVLAVGPGWDWATMIGLYPNVATYTAELRNLETFARNNPNSASARFVLAYHYMTAGHQKEAAITLKEVLVLKPDDQGSANLLKMLEPQAAPNPNPGPAVAAVGNPAANANPALANPAQPNFAAPLPQLDVPPADQPNKVVNAKPIEGPALVGSWQAARDKDKFNLTLGADQTFTWKYAAGERVETLTGTYNVEGSLLVMQVKDGGQMIGRVTLVNDPGGNPAGFEFKMLGGNPDDPGLRFSK